ncbi:GatB/YqeY domain-containing protein [Longimycelium tulufanense]|nr:GatB/YqeY domain-containing protein [Longimycelium tulufanense]
MAELKARLQADLAEAIKGRDQTVVDTLRMALAAVTTEEVAGKQARELSDDEVVKVLRREAKKRREAAEAFAGAGRQELADKERAEGEILDRYLPAQLDDAQLTELARQAVDEVAAQLGERPGPRQMGQVMRVANAKVAGGAEGSRVAAAVRALLQG